MLTIRVAGNLLWSKPSVWDTLLLALFYEVATCLTRVITEERQVDAELVCQGS